MDMLFTPDFYLVFALVQSILSLLSIRFLDLYEREPLCILAPIALWGAVWAQRPYRPSETLWQAFWSP